ncbi:transposase [Chromobacterium haemolyticum]|uniref:transposase n=1 Tax=Chromobacterium haemolyticum TaxID=394935 RepID=UPI0040579DBD
MLKGRTYMNLQLHHVIATITGVTGMRIIRAIVAGERDPDKLAAMRDVRCKESLATIRAALVGNHRPEHVFALKQALALYDFYQNCIEECDQEIERTVARLNLCRPAPEVPLPKAKHRSRMPSDPDFDVRTAMYQLAGTDLTQIHGIGPFFALRLIAECGTDLSRWPTAKHFTSWLTLSPGCKISGGKILSAHTRKTSNRVTVALRLSAVAIGRSNTALGAFYRRLAARIGHAKAVTATARKVAVLFYNAMRFGMDYRDPGADYYKQQYRERVVKQLRCRAALFGFELQLQPAPSVEGVSWEAARYFARESE